MDGWSRSGFFPFPKRDAQRRPVADRLPSTAREGHPGGKKDRIAGYRENMLQGQLRRILFTDSKFGLFS